MANEKKTLADLKQSLSDRHDSGTLPTDSAILAFYIRWLNKGQAYCADKLRLSKSATLTTVAGTIALPDDFLVINEVFGSDNIPLYQCDQDNKPDQEGKVFWITGNHFDGFYLNTPSNATYTIKYAFKPAEMTADGDKCIIPDPEAVVAYAYSFIRKSETDPVGDAGSALQECDARLTEIQDAYSINNAFAGITMQDGI